jgi:LysR family transcriptional activator of nhaA
VRGHIDKWLTQQGLRPRVVGEFEDSALLETFGATGLGIFPAAVAAQHDLLKRSQVRLIGACEGVAEHYFAISTERKVAHPLVQQLLRKK